MTMLHIKFITLTFIWFINSAAVSGFLFIFLSKALNTNEFSSSLSLWAFFLAYWCVAITLYFGSLYLFASRTSPFDELSTAIIFIIGASPFPVTVIFAIWLLKDLKIGW